MHSEMQGYLLVARPRSTPLYTCLLAQEWLNWDLEQILAAAIFCPGRNKH